MEYRALGKSRLIVSELGLGGNNFGWWADEQTSTAVIHKALDTGINFIDTADIYGQGRSEEIIGKAIKGKRDNIIIATKFGRQMGDNPDDQGGSRRYIVKAVDASLRRLQTDYIDLYQMHVPDPFTPIEETLQALNELVEAGKVRSIGCSNFAAWQLVEALWTSEVDNLSPFVTIQARYNLLERDIEQCTIPCCQKYEIGVIPWGPLAGGFLTGKYQKGHEMPADARLAKPSGVYDNVINENNWSKVNKLKRFAKERGHTTGELAIAWLLAKPWISSVIAGARKVDQLIANERATGWKLTDEEIAEIDSLSTI
jgi:aryl-alcohol dehydrogenase-like predicted oxidoreductase